jgi:hypothetical protein
VRAEEIKQYLVELNEELRAMDVKGEICLYGGAVMCLVFDARPATKDVDAVFHPAQQVRQAAQRVAQAHNLRGDWLNDAVKGYVVPHAQRVLFDFSHLKVYVPEPDYMLAMKAIAARVDEADRSDAELLIKLLGLKTPDEVFAIVEKYYPRQQIKPATQFFIEEMFGQ